MISWKPSTSTSKYTDKGTFTMPVDYEKLNRERNWRGETIRANRRFVDMYGDPTHFILELIQNAEDALGKRPPSWSGSRTISFQLLRKNIRIEHYGRPFNTRDVRGITLTLSSVKEDDLTQIGRFGIGFKSVFGVTDRPKIHSGGEDFGIKNLIEPFPISPLRGRNKDATVFILPLNETGKAKRFELAGWLDDFDPTVFLFLRQIDEIAWQVTGGGKGKLRRFTEDIGENIRRTTITREYGDGQGESTGRWLIFSRPVEHGGKPAGNVEMAFRQTSDGSGIQTLSRSPLTVFFPTIVETNLGFLLQGPYQTTLTRENIPPDNSWNKQLMADTAYLVPQALLWLRDNGLLGANTLGCFPIGEEQATAASFFAPLYEATKSCLKSKALLPCVGGVYRRASQTKLGEYGRGATTSYTHSTCRTSPRGWSTLMDKR